MLTEQELQTVTPMLVTVASLAPSPRQFLAAGLYDGLRDDLDEGAPTYLVGKVLELATNDAYEREPPAMVRLLKMLLPDDQNVAGIIRRLRLPPPSAPDPFDALILVSKLPFLDRQSTRLALKRFLEPTPARPVVVVAGDQAGKSYTGEFIDHVLHANPAVRHCRIHVEEGQGRSTGPLELAKDLVAQMGGDPFKPPAKTTNLDRWAQELANWIISVANASNLSWWFLLDGLNPGELRPTDTQRLIKKLASSLTTGVARERHRLVLTDFDRTILPLPPGRIAVETTAPIPHASVARAVAQLVEQSPQPLEADAVTVRVLDGLPDPVADLPELGLRLSDLIAEIESPALAGG